MKCEVWKYKHWVDHVTLRFSEAVNIGLIGENSKPLIKKANIFVSNDFDCTKLATVNPSVSLGVFSAGKDKTPQWVRRIDLISDVAYYLCESLDEKVGATLVCEAGYSKIGDGVLDIRPHIVYAGTPFLTSSINMSNVENVENVIRWGRTQRILGVVSLNASINVLPVNSGLFLCDAFDGDSLITMEYLSG